MNKSTQKICCSSFNALSIMEVIIRIEKGFYPKHHLVQLHRKPITTTKAFSSFTKESFTIFIYFVTGPHSSHTNQQWPLNSIRVKASRPLVFEYFCDNGRILATWSYRYPNHKQVIQHALALPSLSHTGFLTKKVLYKILSLLPIVIAKSY